MKMQLRELETENMKLREELTGNSDPFHEEEEQVYTYELWHFCLAGHPTLFTCLAFPSDIPPK